MNDPQKFWSSVEATHRYVVSGWPKAVHQPSPDPTNRYALPFVFVPPSVSGTFQWLFYWDTFYTNRGLLLDGHLDWAKGNVDNLIYMLNRYGFVPNSNSENGIKYNSQPPYLHFMLERHSQSPARSPTQRGFPLGQLPGGRLNPLGLGMEYRSGFMELSR